MNTKDDAPPTSEARGPEPGNGTLDGGTVLPGFTLPLPRLFARAGRRRGP